MKAEDLRIGNIIEYKGDSLELWTPYELFKATVNIKRGDGNYKPIDITEGWLLKFGLELDKWFGCFRIENDEDVYYLNVRNSFTNVVLTVCDIEHVHQLQNLYFALTGEELEIKS